MQIAWRKNIDEAFARPVTNVGTVILTRSERIDYPSNAIHLIQNDFPNALIVELLGSLCSGDRRRHSNINSSAKGVQSFYWYESNQILATLFPANFGEQKESVEGIESVVVVASSYHAALPLLKLAGAEGAVVTWSRKATCLAKNFSVVWWDDSFATCASVLNWKRRLKSLCAESVVQPRHVWIANLPQAQDIKNAKLAGVEFVISKPYQIDALESTLFTQTAGWLEQLNAA